MKFKANDMAREQQIWFGWILARADCQILSRASDISLARSILAQPQNDPNIKHASLCTLQELNYINADGTLQEDVIKVAIGDFFGDDTESFYSDCLVELDTPVETAYNFIQCFRIKEQQQPNNFGSGPKIEN